MGKKYIFKLIMVAALALSAFNLQAQQSPMPPQGQGMQQPGQGMQQPGQGMPPMGQQGQEPAPQTVSTSDPNVVRASEYAASEIKAGRVSSILEASKRGDMQNPIYTIKLETLDASGNDNIYQVDVCIPTDGKPMSLKSSQQIDNTN